MVFDPSAFDPTRGGNRSAAAPLARFAGVLLLGVALLAAGAAGQKRKPAKPAPKPPAPPAVAVVPFHSGEVLNFRVLWSKFSVNAALVKFSVVERRDFFSHPAWHFRVQAQTVDTTRLLYALDDQFDSYTDAVQLASLQYEIYLHEQGKQQNNVWRMSSQGEPAPPDVAAARVAPGTRDPVDLLYILRAADWKSTPEFRAPVFDGVHLYDIVARLGEVAGQSDGAGGDVQGIPH